ncbi:MAG: histidine phosphatase family protein [Dehalococcoidia bacterium]
MTVVYVRHGESEGNVQRIIQGWLDFPLTPRGEAQAEAAGRRIATTAAVALYTSPLLRARRTAEIIGNEAGLEVVPIDGLREYGFGEAEGLRWPEAAARWGLADRDWGVGQVPGEEGMEPFRQRVREASEALHERHRDSLAVAVVHGGVLGAMLGTLWGLAPHEHVQVYSSNCGMTTVADERGQPAVIGLNDVCHLREGVAT